MSFQFLAKKTTLAVAVSITLNTAFASPQNGSVISGSATIHQAGNGTTVTQQTQEAWIDWQQFSIGADEWVHFEQLVADGLSVNRVTGNDVSEIFGSLTSNGTVYLVNPNGILFGENAQLDVGSLFATDHWLEADGELTSSSQSAGIKVLGEINSREELTLLAESIENSGSLTAENVSLLGSKGALLHLDEAGAVSVLVPAGEEQQSWIENTGAIVANENIYLGSPHKNDWLNQLAAEANVSLSGSLNAQSIDVNGSSIDVMNAALTADLIDIESQTTTYIGASNLSAVDEKIRIRGTEIQIHSGTQMDVGSGQLTIGGYYQGKGADNNADFVHISSTVHLYGNGGENGNGGEIILWSDGTTSFQGNIEAKGGEVSGDGGFVEVSGKETLVFRGDVDTSAVNGAMGTLLLDPTIITIANGTGGANDAEVTGDGIVASGDVSGSPITISEQALEGISAATNIELQATQAIIIEDLADDTLTLDQTGTVTFTVQNSAGEGRFVMNDINDTIAMTGGGNLNINVSGNLFESSPTNSVSVSIGNISFSSGGSLIVSASNSVPASTSSDIDMSIGDISITGDGDVNLSVDNTAGSDVGAATLALGNLIITGSGANQVDITVNNDNAAAATIGASSLYLNGDITTDGDETAGHYINIDVQQDSLLGGTIYNYGDINSSGGDITISAGAMDLLDADGRNIVSAMNSNSAGGEVDITAFGAGAIDGQGTTSFEISTTTNHNLDWDEFTNLDTLVYQTAGDVQLGVDGTKDISNAELTQIGTYANRFFIQTTGNITTTSASSPIKLQLYADRENDGTGSVILNGLTIANDNLDISGADISGNGSATDVGTGLITISGVAGQDISVGGSSGFNIEPTVWNNFSTSESSIVIGAGGIIFWEHSTLGGDVVLNSSGGAGTVFQNGPFTFSGANTFQLIGDTYFYENFSMSNAGSSLDLDGLLYVGSSDTVDGNQAISVTGNWDTTDLTDIILLGDANDTVSLSHIAATDFALPDVSTIRAVDLSVDSASSISLSALTTNNGDALFMSDDIDGDGSAIDVGTGTLTLRQDGVANAISIGDAGSETYNIEANIWDFITAGSLIIDTTGAGDTFTFLEDTLPTNTTFNGVGGSLTFDGVAQNFTGATLTSTADVIFLQNFTSDSLVDVTGAVSVGATSGGAGQSVTLTGDFDFAAATGFALLGDTGDSVFIDHNGSAALELPSVTSPNGSPLLNIDSDRSLTMNGFDGGNLIVAIDSNNNSTNFFNTSGTYVVNDLSITGTGNNDTSSIDGTWTIAGDVTVTNINTLTLANTALSANSFDLTGASTIDFSTGTAFGMTSTGGNIALGTVTSDRRINFNSAGSIALQGVTTTNDQISLRATDVSSDGSAINLGTGRVLFQIQSGSNLMSIGDAGTSPYNIEANIWDALTVGSIELDAIGGTDTITFLEDTLPANLILDGPAGSLTFDGVAQTFTGATITANSNVVFLQNFSTDSTVDVNGNLTIGTTNAGNETTTISGDFRLDGVTAFDLAGDTGDIVNLDHVGSVDLAIPVAITSTNGTVDLDLDLRRGGTLNGFDGGNLLVEIDSNNNGGNTMAFDGAYNVAGLVINGNFNTTLNDDVSIDGTWTIADSVTITNVSGVTLLNDAFNAGTSLSVSTAATITLGTSATNYDLSAGNGNLVIGDVTANRPMTISASGSLSAGFVDVASRALTLTSDSDLVGDEGIGVTDIRAGGLTLAGDMAWSFDPTLSGIYTQSRGDVSFTDVTLSAFGIDITSADSLTLSGTSNAFEARSGSVTLTGATDDGSNAALDVQATGAITLTNVDTGTGNIALESNTDASGSEKATINTGSGSVLTLNSDSVLSGTLSFSNLTMNGVDVSGTSFDSSNLGSVNLTGTQNSFTINGGNLVLDTPTLAAGSNLTLNVGAGSHRLDNLNIGSGNIYVNGISGTSNQLVTAEGTWAYDTLTVDAVDTFTNNAQLVGSGDTSLDVTNDITLSDGSTLTSDRVILTAGDDVTVTGVTAESQQIPSIIITAGGDLLDGGNTNTDLDTYWFNSVEYDVAGSVDSLDVNFEIGGDIGSIEDDLASVSDPEVSVIADESESTNPLDGAQASVGSLPKNRVDVFIPQCSGNDKNCRKKNAVRKFLSALMIGGALPE